MFGMKKKELGILSVCFVARMNKIGKRDFPYALAKACQTIVAWQPIQLRCWLCVSSA